ncbi:MAG TPA: GAF domain-containing sensor histidine kinase, partial [Actinomycetota bacterium]|nr:GAF domain-containing sensor histidine kinase [Actinomycetota bacterium]
LIYTTLLPMALPAFLLLFPDGRLRFARWRVALWSVALGGVLLLVGSIGQIDGFGEVPLSPPDWTTVIPAPEVVYIAGLLVTFAASLAGFVALVLRYRSASADERHPLRLLVAMIAAMAIATTPALAVLPAAGGAEWTWIAIVLAFLVDGFGVLIGIPVATAAAVFTYGLFDVGIVVKKTVVYVLLVALFVGLLVAFALMVSPLAFIGVATGSAERGDAVVARILTTVAVFALIAVFLFRPMKRIARRLVYGKRSTRYEAMAEFSDRLGDTYSTDDVLPRMAEIVRASTGADVARVWLRLGGELRPVAAAPSDAPHADTLDGSEDELPQMDGLRAFPVRDRGELLGALTVQMPAAEPLSKDGERLVNDLTGQAGLVLRNVRLIEELQESRRRIVAAQDERARKLERDLHDGAQQQLVALSVKLGLAETLATRDPEKARTVLAELRGDATDALDTLRDLARGIYPPLLADKGLGAALEAQARKSAVHVHVEAAGSGRYPQEVEAAVYFCVLEALQNMGKYADATSARIGLAQRDGHLMFEVVDDGVGFDLTSAHGTGLTNMRDRVEAVGGTLRIASNLGEGTAIRGRIPVGVLS